MSKSKDAFRNDQSWDRWNTHQTTMVEQEVFGTVLRFVQDPSSEHLGTTVWDASVVLAKWFEKNIRKGDFARAKVRGRKAIELGAGMGLAGMAFAMVGADVVLTDTADVLGLLRINYETNLSPAAVRLARGHQHGTWADSAGSVQVAELDWTKPEQVTAPPLHPPYDFVLAADCIYHETLTEHFHRTVMDLTNDKSTVVVCNELRSHSVQGRFMELFTATHSIKAVPHSKMDDTFQHPNIFIYIMKKKKKMQQQQEGAGAASKAGGSSSAGGAPEDDKEEEVEDGEVDGGPGGEAGARGAGAGEEAEAGGADGATPESSSCREKQTDGGEQAEAAAVTIKGTGAAEAEPDAAECRGGAGAGTAGPSPQGCSGGSCTAEYGEGAGGALVRPSSAEAEQAGADEGAQGGGLAGSGGAEAGAGGVELEGGRGP